MSRRINGQFDDITAEYRLEQLINIGFRRTWDRVANRITLKNAEAMQRRLIANGTHPADLRIKHESDY